jgi:hypothetical protein
VEFINKLELKFLFMIVLRNLQQLMLEVNEETGQALTLEGLDADALSAILRREEERNKEFGEKVKSILSVFMILEKVKDFSDKVRKEASRDPVDH